MLKTRYFRMKDPQCRPEEIEWVEMSGRDFYRFVNSPEGQRRHFIDMGDVVLEGTEAQARQYKAEQNHRCYILAQEEGWSTSSIYTIADKNGYSGEEIIRDDTQDVEAEVILRMERRALQAALYQLDKESRALVQALYLADTRKTLRQFSQDSGIPVMMLQDRKKKSSRCFEMNCPRKISKNFSVQNPKKSAIEKAKGQNEHSLSQHLEKHRFLRSYPATE